MNACKIRHATGKDIPFIYDTWLNSFRYDSPLGKTCKNSIFFNEYKLVIDRILARAETLIAHAPEDENLILAYLCFERPAILHYSFCKEALRSFGIATALFTEAFGDKKALVQFTHRTGYVANLLRDHPQLTHNPFHLYLKGAL